MCNICAVYLILLRESLLQRKHDYEKLHWQFHLYLSRKDNYQLKYQRNMFVCVILILIFILINLFLFK